MPCGDARPEWPQHLAQGQHGRFRRRPSRLLGAFEETGAGESRPRQARLRDLRQLQGAARRRSRLRAFCDSTELPNCTRAGPFETPYSICCCRANRPMSAPTPASACWSRSSVPPTFAASRCREVTVAKHRADGASAKSRPQSLTTPAASWHCRRQAPRWSRRRSRARRRYGRPDRNRPCRTDNRCPSPRDRRRTRVPTRRADAA